MIKNGYKIKLTSSYGTITKELENDGYWSIPL